MENNREQQRLNSVLTKLAEAKSDELPEILVELKGVLASYSQKDLKAKMVGFSTDVMVAKTSVEKDKVWEDVLDFIFIQMVMSFKQGFEYGILYGIEKQKKFIQEFIETQKEKVSSESE